MSNQETNYKECKGCAHKSNGCLLWRYSPLRISECPCINCIVKMMCKEMCEPRITLYKSIPILTIHKEINRILS